MTALLAILAAVLTVGPTVALAAAIPHLDQHHDTKENHR